jgi:LuxR family transcriptional regulator, quorum-sensing system regulator SdiA
VSALMALEFVTVNQTSTYKRVSESTMDTQAEIGNIVAELMGLAPTGFAVALHVRFTTPTFLFQTYPKEWIDLYSQNGYVMRDPTVHWGFENTGTVRWANLVALDGDGIMQKAAGFGMVHGFTAAVDVRGNRSLGSFTRGDRDFTDEGIDRIAGRMARLHDLTATAGTLSANTRDALRRLSVTFTHP